MPTIHLALDSLHPKQQQIVSEASLRNVWVSGRQSGKTHQAHHLIVKTMLDHRDCGLFVPTFKTASESWRQLKDRLHDVIVSISEAERRLEILGGGSLEVWSLDDPGSGRGRQYDLVIIDEAGQVRDLEAAWASIQPMLAIRNGVAWIISTPCGSGTFLHSLFEKGRGLFRGKWRSWQTTSSCNPFLAPEQIEQAKADLGERSFAQEYEAQWISWQGGVFDRIRDAVTDSPEGAAGIVGVDWAGSTGGGDWTVAIVLSTSGHVLELMRTRGEPFELQRAKLRGLWERHGRPPVWAEQNGMGQSQNEALRAEGIAVRDWITSNASKTEIVAGLVQAFETGNIRIPDDEILIGELQSFQCTPLAGGQFRYGASAGHDDCVMALCIAHAGLGDAVQAAARKLKNVEFGRQIMEANNSLKGWGSWLSGGGDDPSMNPECGDGRSDRGERTIIDEDGRRIALSAWESRVQ